MTTVGENFYPITPLRKLACGLIIILGVATFALPTSILTSGFVEELERRQEEKEAPEKATKTAHKLHWKEFKCKTEHH